MNWRSRSLSGRHHGGVVEMVVFETAMTFKIIVDDTVRFLRRCESRYDLQAVGDDIKRLIGCPEDRAAALAFIHSHKHRF